MRRAQVKATKSSKRKEGVGALAFRFIAIAAVLYLSWLVVVPASLSGEMGGLLSGKIFAIFGYADYLLPLFLIHGLFVYVKEAKRGGWIVTALASALSVLAACALLSIVAPAEFGGRLGAALAGNIAFQLGPVGAGILSVVALCFGLQLVFGIKWGQVASELLKVVAADYKEWQRTRTELSLQISAATAAETKKNAQKAGAVAAPAVNGAPKEPIKPVDVTKPLEKIVPREIKSEPPKAARAVQSEARADAPPAPKDSPYANYKLPSLELLNPPPPAENRGKPTEAEIQAAIASLETALKNFDIEARVTGYAPGPVITRYELSPAPGVKVSSIVALENDIALAMRAKGIRIIAPIPGKAAVGIEIPNARPAMVVLRELLESPQAVPADAPLLTFGLGLAADGMPKGADIQKMPHLLVAGATNSGKSVAIHSMILSILFRARPDEVKFMMIDPKRLELTFYDGIPHLFDPTQAADKVSVVTNPKDASKSLLALVRLMEKRYEKFQLYGVRNIDSFNKEADKRGQPREFFIVVVIDELADLMLVASDTVEDSIQRLTQMARAVGIHLILATQRPSVDVITGVIKANLPARLALQVISKIDSKVILDSSGAETLQGKGDLLYLAAGAQKPERCQGAYVSEEEINRLAAYLKTQGKPDYPVLETMAAKGGAAEDLATLGVEPLEFSQALKLVLERRRVSQDLLKSQFGSSARATNLLSALEVKELIHKPEGSNRWEIHFDQIEDYLRTHFPQVPLGDAK